MSAAKVPPAPWGEAHALEAGARGYELAAPVWRSGNKARAGLIAGIDGATEADFRALLGRAGFDAARIDREVRRVRGLAEGRLVRERPRYFAHILGEYPHGPYNTAAEARRDAGDRKRRIVRVTRIRKAPEMVGRQEVSDA